MSLLYVSYLGLTLIGTLLLMRLFRVSFFPIQKKSIVIALGLTTIFFVVWDIIAVMRGHWSFGLQHTLGILISNQPLEEIGFFLAIPFFGIVLYSIFNLKQGKTK